MEAIDKLEKMVCANCCRAEGEYFFTIFNILIGNPTSKKTIDLKGKDIEEIAHAIANADGIIKVK